MKPYNCHQETSWSPEEVLKLKSMTRSAESLPSSPGRSTKHVTSCQKPASTMAAYCWREVIRITRKAPRRPGSIVPSAPLGSEINRGQLSQPLRDVSKL